MSFDPPSATREVYTVSRLNQAVRLLLEGTFPLLWVEGEISNLSRPNSGHVYFSLKDARAQVRCALFRNRARSVRARLKDGMQVLLRARISLYEQRGDFQLIAEHVEEAGDGALRRAYDELRQRLAAEGLFDEKHKRAVPHFPHQVGIITSPTGAAIRDVISVLKRRFPGLPVLIYPAAVQGDGAPSEITKAVDMAQNRRECDVLLLVRGGGSLEDLWAFNDERVARAIHACDIPIVCGVGHEIDFTIADFVADLRAPTPSAAAELVSPDRVEWLRKVSVLHDGLIAGITRRLTNQHRTLFELEQRHARQHPGRRLMNLAQRLDELETRMSLAARVVIERATARLAAGNSRLRAQALVDRIQRSILQQRGLHQRLEATMQRQLREFSARLSAASRALHAVSPLQTLERGYAIVRRHADGTVVRRPSQVRIGERVDALLKSGQLNCVVESIDEIP